MAHNHHNVLMVAPLMSVENTGRKADLGFNKIILAQVALSIKCHINIYCCHNMIQNFNSLKQQIFVNSHIL